MSWYYKESFASPSPIYAKIKEELSSYFSAGLVDDLLFPIWTNYCIRRFEKTAYKIQEAFLFVDDYQCKLPPDFNSVREAWATQNIMSGEFRTAGNYYRAVTTRVSTTADPCQLAECCSDECNPCSDADSFESVFKTTTYETRSFSISHLLRPGNVNSKHKCDARSPNVYSSSRDTFDIRDGKFLTNFNQGDVYLIYYSIEDSDDGTPMIPANVYFEEYLEQYIKCKVFEQLWNNVTDETFNQIQTKYQIYEQKKNEAYVAAESYFKRHTLQQDLNQIAANRRSMNKYRIR